jgi:phenylpropionate dioxygenase-like ring-hydroxylating dioxygenase large terminal subunit
MWHILFSSRIAAREQRHDMPPLRGHHQLLAISRTDLPPRHVYHGQLWGRELAVWRADDGFVNVWEKRCLHRGVRLSIGLNEGHELRCLYHGWRYANRTAGCTYIPAHPADAPARTICNNTYLVD